MNQHILTIASLTALLLLGGCVINVNDEETDYDNWRSEQKRNQRSIDSLTLGRTIVSVQQEMGKADMTESFRRGDHDYVVLFYRTRHVDSDGTTSRDETTPLVFVNSELVGWGDSAVENAVP